MYALTKSMITLATTDDEREDDDDPLDGRVVTVLEVRDERVADARPVERRLRQHGSRQQQGDGQAHDRDDRNERVPEGVLVDDRALVDAPRTCSLDVVVLHRADHVDANQSDEDARGHEAERDGRQHQVLDRVRERAPVAVDERVDRVEPGVGLDRRLRRSGSPDRRSEASRGTSRRRAAP